MANFFKLGNASTDTISGAKLLSTRTATASQYSALGSPYQVGYAVTSGKTLYITSLVVVSEIANPFFWVGYANVTSTETASAPAGITQLTGWLNVGPTAYLAKEYQLCIPIPTGKFPTVFSSSGAGVIAYTAVCIEV